MYILEELCSPSVLYVLSILISLNGREIRQKLNGHSKDGHFELNTTEAIFKTFSHVNSVH